MKFKDRQISSRLAAPTALVGILVSAAVVALTIWAANRADEDMVRRNIQRVDKAVVDALAEIPYEQASVTVWDDAAAKVSAPIDREWIHLNLGEWLYQYFSHDQVILLNDRDEAIYGMLGGEEHPPEDLEADVAGLRDLIYQVRHKLIMRTVYEDQNLFRAGPRVTDLGVVRGHPAIISLQPILLNSGESPLFPGSEALHISVRYLDGNFLEQLAGRLDLPRPRFSWTGETGPSELSYPLRSSESLSRGFIIWSPERPAGKLLAETAPLIALTLGVLAVILSMFLLWLRRATKELEESEARTRHQASHDALTGLPNRGSFDLAVTKAFSPHNQGAKCGVFYIDLDRFKDVNDSLGHPSGDLLLKQVSDRLVAIAATATSVARLGGDEFAILASVGGQFPEAEEFCQAILNVLQSPFDIHGREIFVGASIGVAVGVAPHYDCAELVRRADIALYRSKAEGRSRYSIFSPDMDEAVQRRRKIQDELRTAIPGNGLNLVYQPFYSPDETLVGVEALVRWRHPVQGTITPDQFIPIAEEFGLIGDLGDWVLREACRTASLWSIGCVAVNVSAIQFQSPNFAARVLEIIRNAGLSPQRVELEITETVLADGSEVAAKCIQKLRLAGVKVSIDDFGTGYSSLSYLQRFPLDKIKIDRSFVQPLEQSGHSHAIVVAMVELARALGVKITAEGVETAEQMSCLKAIGCDYFQGYHLSRPLTHEQMETLALGSGARVYAA